ncbi:MAG TPA: hypothetical protein VGP67_08175, partial [Gaiellales bacterium]|nr:hypothetical protein [Gaiellales bacterium]
MAIAQQRRDRSPAEVIASGYRSILVPVNTALPHLPVDIVDVAARLATERRSSIVLMAFTEIPLWEEMDVELPGLDDHVHALATEARA